MDVLFISSIIRIYLVEDALNVRNQYMYASKNLPELSTPETGSEKQSPR